MNESSTLFWRKFYQNGSHAGLILYTTDPAHSEKFVDDLRDAMKNSKGPGNFRNLFMYAPNGKTVSSCCRSAKWRPRMTSGR